MANALRRNEQPRSTHPIFRGDAVLMSGENPKFPAQTSGHEELVGALTRSGIPHDEIEGKYEGKPERSVAIYGLAPAAAAKLGKDFGQEAVVVLHNGKQRMLYTNGDKAGRWHPGEGVEVFPERPDDYYSTVPGLGHMRLNFDWDKLEGPHAETVHKASERSAFSALAKAAAPKNCPHCRGTGTDAAKTKAARKSGRIDEASTVRCWNCHGNGLDPAEYFDWGDHPQQGTAKST